MKLSLYKYCIENNYTELLEQWHPTKNGDVRPEHRAFRSNRKAWWICNKGHEWEAAILHRSRGSSCPYCAGQKIWPGLNDLATIQPELAAQWHPTKNRDLTPQIVGVGSRERVWWVCEKGHEWEAQIGVRAGTLKRGCPVCAGRNIIAGENDLATIFPEIAKEWHPTKNGDLRPDAVAPHAERKVWWMCENGHEFENHINRRTTNGAGCPYCSGRTLMAGGNDLATINPPLAAQWHPSKNGDLHPGEVTSRANRKVWWLCDKGHEFEMTINQRARGGGCPYCYGNKIWAGLNDIATLQPELAAQWHPTKNGDLTPQMVGVGTHKRAWWVCEKGHEWETLVFLRAGRKKTGCPYCAGRKTKGGSPAE